MAGQDKLKKKSRFNGQRMVLILFVIVVGFFLWTEHRAHTLGALPYLIILLCPLMHMFMHRGHRGSHNGNEDNDERRQK